MKKISILLVIVAMVFAALPASAQMTPAVEVSDQVSLDGSVVIDKVVSEGDGFVVIHIDNGGSPGPVAGFTWLHPGEQSNVRVWIDTTMATPVLFSILHVYTR